VGLQVLRAGEWTLAALRDELEDRGLTTVPGPQRPARPISTSQLHRYLRSSYYVGRVTYGGVEYEGQHPKLIDEATWQRVQEVLTSRSVRGEKNRTHQHYLKSTVYCAQCGSRLIVSLNTNRHGTTYPYFVCVGRHQKRTACTQRAIRIEAVEERVEDEYANYSLSAAEADDLRAYLRAEFARLDDSHGPERRLLERQLEKLQDERLKLLQAHYAGAVPLDLLKQEQARIGGQLRAAENRLQAMAMRLGEINRNLDRALAYLTDLRATYLKAPSSIRRQINQAVYVRIEIGDDGSSTATLRQPYQALTNPDLRRAAAIFAERTAEEARAKGRRATNPGLDRVRSFLTVARSGAGVKETHLAEGVGFEPTRTLPRPSGFQDRRHRPLGEPSRLTSVAGSRRSTRRTRRVVAGVGFSGATVRAKRSQPTA
jgi:site-specific DNA recombinase